MSVSAASHRSAAPAWAVLRRGLPRAADRFLAVVILLVVVALPGPTLPIGTDRATLEAAVESSIATTSASADPVLAVAGDIACEIGSTPATASCQQGATADVVSAAQATAVLPLGDEQYESGSAAAFTQMYDPSWGRARTISHPAVGNHEYQTRGANGYYGYFGTAAGASAKGYYSWDVGGWHLIALNSECSQGSQIGCAAGSPQEQWLKADLAAHPGVCTLAYWHQPRFSSGNGGSNAIYQPFWQDLYDAHADVVLNGHSHAYERFGPQSPTGAADSARGVRQFVVGTGGVNLQGFTAALPNEEVRQNSTFGILRLVLHSSSYDWQFQSTAGGTWTDSGSGACHLTSPAPWVPSVPTGLVVSGTPTASRVSLAWSASSEGGGSGTAPTIAGYRVYRNGAATPLNSVLVTGTSFTDSTVSASTTYSYAVAAVDSAGAESARSSSVNATTAAAPVSSGFVNGGFENGLSGWTVSGPGAGVATGRASTSSALVGSMSPSNGLSSITQTFSVANSSTTSTPSMSTLSFWWQGHCPDTVTYDWATATLVDSANGTTSTLLPSTCSNTGAWVQVTASVVGGRTYTLTLSSRDDNYAGDATYTQYDDVLLTPVSSGIVNGGFENGLSGWTVSGPGAGVTTGRTSTSSALVGSMSPSNGLSSITQTFSVANSSTTSTPSMSTLSFWWQGHCPDTVTYDWATATLVDSANGTTSTLLPSTCSNTGAWVQVTASVVGGRTYTLTLSSRDDNYAGDATYTQYDDVLLTP